MNGNETRHLNRLDVSVGDKRNYVGSDRKMVISANQICVYAYTLAYICRVKRFVHPRAFRPEEPAQSKSRFRRTVSRDSARDQRAIDDRGGKCGSKGGRSVDGTEDRIERADGMN